MPHSRANDTSALNGAIPEPLEGAIFEPLEGAIFEPLQGAILWIATVWPEPGSSAAGYRTLQLIEALRAAGERVEVCSPTPTNAHREKLEAAGIRTAHHEPNSERFDEYVRDLKPAVVFFDRFMIEEQFSWRVREQCPEALRVLDTIDLHSLRRARQRRVETATVDSASGPGVEQGQGVNLDSPRMATLAVALGDLTAEELLTVDGLREVSAIHRSDLSLVVSDYERDLLRDRYQVPPSVVELCRFLYREPTPGPTFADRADFVTIGNFRHPPNLDAFHQLHREIWPRLRRRLLERGVNAQLHIYGAYPPREAMSLDDAHTGFRVKGWADDALKTLARYRVNLAPLRFGGGIKGKISDSWLVGTPNVSTSIGAEGMHEHLPFGGAVADEVDAFVDAAWALYVDESKWGLARDRGAAIMREFYAAARLEPWFVARIRRAYAERSETRARNPMGAMLWYHGARSTEYFSRWIETKRKLALEPGAQPAR